MQLANRQAAHHSSWRQRMYGFSRWSRVPLHNKIPHWWIIISGQMRPCSLADGMFDTLDTRKNIFRWGGKRLHWRKIVIFESTKGLNDISVLQFVQRFYTRSLNAEGTSEILEISCMYVETTCDVIISKFYWGRAGATWATTAACFSMKQNKTTSALVCLNYL